MCMLEGGWGGGGNARTLNVLLFVVITLHPNSLVIFIRSVKMCYFVCVLTGVVQGKRGGGVWVVAGQDSHAEGGVCCGGVHRMGQLLY